MIGVAKDNLGLYVVGEVALLHGFHGASRANGHKNRGFDAAVSSVYYAGAGFGLRVVGY
jgi:hypothetical protein